jgi:hypothetical protein
MNCKKGDIAMYVGKAPELANIRGHLFRCMEWITDTDGREGWLTDPPPREGHAGLRDHVLRPIRDPGPRAVDEMLVVCGVPREVAA